VKTHKLAAALVAATATLAALPAFAGTGAPDIIYVPRKNPPPNVPADLNVTCANTPQFTALADKCPIIKYQGYVTWVLSYKDNRFSMAVVTWDGTGKVVRNVEQKGARYIVNAVSSSKTHTITLSGQDSKTITLPWSDFANQ
jgi:hypothetical protein